MNFLTNWIFKGVTLNELFLYLLLIKRTNMAVYYTLISQWAQPLKLNQMSCVVFVRLVMYFIRQPASALHQQVYLN